MNRVVGQKSVLVATCNLKELIFWRDFQRKTMNVSHLLPFLVLCGALTYGENVTETNTKLKKALSVFQVVRFPNIACIGGTNVNGTCYTQSECNYKGGTSSGTCANGFGICCTFIIGCGSTIAENCSYFQSNTLFGGGGNCNAKVCKCSPDICQLRLDFNTFTITGPSTFSVSSIFTKNGVPSTSGVPSSLMTQCLTDTFSVTGNTASPPVICGINTGFHMYTDANPSCNDLLFQFGSVAVGTTLATRQWNIKITQISCLSQWLAPPGCTQYFTGPTNIIQSYNFAGGTQLANQRQNICIRRERGNCRLCLTQSVAMNTDFQVSAMKGSGFLGTNCCNYASSKSISMFDCLVIPNAVTKNNAQVKGNQFCGKFLATMTGTTGQTVCTSQQPFNVQFITDATSPTSPATPGKAGFRLTYFQTVCTT